MASPPDWHPHHPSMASYRGGPPPPRRAPPPYYESRTPPAPMDRPPSYGSMYGGGAPYGPPPPYARDSAPHPPPSRHEYWGGGGGGGNDFGPVPPYGPPPPSQRGGGGWYPPHQPRMERPSPGVTEEYPPSSWPQPPSGLVIRSKRSADESEGRDRKDNKEQASKDKKDPLSLLAKVSSTMEDDNQNDDEAMGPPAKKKSKNEQQREKTSTPPPESKVMKTVVPVQTSPIRGGPRVSPIVSPRSKRHDIIPPQPTSHPSMHHAPKLITPTVSYHKEAMWDGGPGGSGGAGGGYPRYPHPGQPRPLPPPTSMPQQQPSQPYYPSPPPGGRGGQYPTPHRGYHSHYQGEPSPVLVEHSSFDSVESGDGRYGNYYDGYRGGPYPPHEYGWWQQQQHQQRSSEPYPPSYLPPRWAYPSGPYDGPPPPQMMQGPPPPHRYDEQLQSPSPYAYVQQPHLESKTVLKKKFSWKNYPELEGFLIANRDEYLKHSSKNYTMEQKQYNNWLTERLMEVAHKYHYVFDKEDFNFVAIRDRIRCYYKSYVQTARKRGLPLPAGIKAKDTSDKKNSLVEQDEGDDDDDADAESKSEKYDGDDRDDQDGKSGNVSDGENKKSSGSITIESTEKHGKGETGPSPGIAKDDD